MDGELIRHKDGFVNSYSDTYVDAYTYANAHAYADCDSYTCSYRNTDTYDCFLQLERYVGYGMGHDGAGSNGEQRKWNLHTR